ncbi:MAG TPA: phosphatase PAP2 family protein [Candidatus Angelobacter sp.]|nr:phosphatase PAP2 family protein [Candidatus Angelobacter sp.]
MSHGRRFLYWLIACVLCGVAVVLSVAYIDRPVADFVHANLHQTRVFFWFARALDPLIAAVAFGLLFLLGTGCWLLAGRRLSLWAQTPLLCCWSLVWALSSVVVLKRIFGRGSAYPDYVRDRLYGFHWLNGTHGHDAFPSGTTAIAAAILIVLWVRIPRLRAIWAAVLALIAVGLVVTNSHFVADVIGGAFLGTSIGWMTVLFLQSATFAEK